MNKPACLHILKSERGGTLLLVLISIILLSVTGISMFRQSQTEYAMARNFFDDKVGLLIADSGINFTINELRGTVNPIETILDSSSDPDLNIIATDGTNKFDSVLRTGPIETTESEAQKVQALTSFKAPWPPGVDISSGSGMTPTGWDLIVSARMTLSGDEKIRALKQIQNGVVLMSPGH
jgi:hypothetical protein